MFALPRKIQMKRDLKAKTYWLMLSTLVLLLTFNVQSGPLRLILVASMIIMPLVILYDRPLNRGFIVRLISSILIVTFFFLSVLLNVDTFSLSLSGPQGEIFAAIVGISFVFYLALVQDLRGRGLDYRYLLKSFLILYTAILLADIAVRYIEAPSCFLNYFCRKEAKTVGFFNTTNVTGVNVATILMTVIVTRQVAASKLIFVLLHFVLLSTMARAAIVSYVVVVLIYLTFSAHLLIRLFVCIVLLVAVFYIAIVNPYNILNDGSLLSKFDFLSRSLEIARGASLYQLLFGFGASFDSVARILNVSGWSPHIPFLKAFFYFGLPGFAIYFFSIAVTLYVGGTRFIWPLLVNQIAAMAGGPMYSPTLTCALVILVLLRSQLIREESK